MHFKNSIIKETSKKQTGWIQICRFSWQKIGHESVFGTYEHSTKLQSDHKS